MGRVFPLLVGFLVFGGCDCGDDDVMDMDGDVPMEDGEMPEVDMGDPMCVGMGGDCDTADDCCEGPCEGGICSEGSCSADGVDCSVGADCCSGTCSGGVCNTPVMCADLGESCSADGDCCTANCDGGTCASAVGCSTFGTACTAAGDCCSGNCADEAGEACAGGGSCACAPAPACTGTGEACSDDGECCNNLCDDPDGDGDGLCANIGACLSAGEPCGTEGFNGSCCSTVCLDKGDGARCQFLGGCRVQDDLCASDAECCSGSCEPSGTTADGRPILRCANTGSCQPVGEVCGGMGATSNCCPNGGGDTGCEPTGAGFRRCLGGDGSCVLPSRECTDDPENCCTDAYPTIDCRPATDDRADDTRVYCCLNDGDECAFGDVCCSGVCTPDPTDGVLRCGDTCIDDGGACTVDSDCCGCGCVEGVCTSDADLCDPCTGPQLGDLCDPDGEACCNAPTVTCGGGEFPTCTLAG